MISVRFTDSAALRLLIARPLFWRPKKDPRPDDVDWLPLSAQSYGRERELAKQLAAKFKIRYRPKTRQFWETLSGCLLSLFPAAQIRRETRGRRRKVIISDDERQQAAAAGPKERKRVRGKIAERHGVRDSTVDRALRRARSVNN